MNTSRLITIAFAGLLVATPLFANEVGGDEAAKSLCSLPHYPVAVGDVNEYQVTSNQLGAERQVLETMSSAYTEEVTVVELNRYRTKSVIGGNTSEANWSCSDEGIELVLGEFPDIKATSTGITIPAHMEVGGVWSQTLESEGPGFSQMSRTVNRITTMEQVVVPAGTFDAYRVDFEIETTAPEQPPSYVRGSQWFAPSVGIVKSTSVIEMQQGEISTVETTVELTKRLEK